MNEDVVVAPVATEKRRQLFLQQKALLENFLLRGAISKAQFDKSYSDLKMKMGFDDAGNETESPREA